MSGILSGIAGWYADVALTGTDGYVKPFFNGTPVAPGGGYYVAVPGNQTTGQVCLEQGSSCVAQSTVQPVAGTLATAKFYLGDHLGTAQLELSAGGWPVWQGQFAPFGGELSPQSTTNHYKFTGKERDSESGLDYFGARYYASSMGRWMSPDWSERPTPIPYADLGNPQSLNLYSFVLNNPLRLVDVDGHDGCAISGVEVNCGSLASDAVASASDKTEEEANYLLAQQQNGPVLPNNPSGLGSGWQDVTPTPGGKVNPKIPKRFRGPKGTEVEFDPGVEGRPGWGGKDHWHEVGPDGKREDGHLAPGSPIPGPDGVPEPAQRSIMDRMRSITPGPILKLGTAGVIIYILIDEGSRLYPPRNLVPVP